MMQIRITLIILTVLLTINSNATTYYVSNNTGNDSNSGTSQNAAWKTLDKVNTFSFSSGDSILFERNNSWRGQLIPQSGTLMNRIYYGAYSTGEKPIILGSLSFNNVSDWVNVSGNIWKCNTTFSTDIGNIIFNDTTSFGVKKWNLSDLQNQNDFWFDLSTNELYMFSLSNPATIYSEIELAIRKNIVDQQNTSFVTYENLSLKYGGAHGFGGGNTSYITIRSCDISYIGGGDLFLNGITRFGNGIEFWGNAANNIVEKCKIWEIYDSGLTNQNNLPNVTQQNIRYQNNIIWNCGLASFEYWNNSTSSTTSNIYFENNTCLFAGYGLGEQRPDYHGMHVELNTSTAHTDTIFIRNNIFYNAKRFIYAIEDSVKEHSVIDYNIIYQSGLNDSIYISFPSYIFYTYSDFASYVSATLNDVNSLTGNPDFTNIAGNDFTLLSSSIAIDAGINLNNIVDDFDNNPRPYNYVFDIGAYEFVNPLNINSYIPSENTLVYPNPTNNAFRIKFNKKHKEPYIVNIYNLKGQKIRIIDNYFNNDEIKIENLKNGIYWFTISNEFRIIKTGEIIIQK